jgi:hypothetical protein
MTLVILLSIPTENMLNARVIVTRLSFRPVGYSIGDVGDVDDIIDLGSGRAFRRCLLERLNLKPLID